ncbi:MAG: hypothetical protein P8J25_05740, partial [Porticoccaceae bacterium]|nr:hypothetical protein [Porticoccaceae bacterium]
MEPTIFTSTAILITVASITALIIGVVFGRILGRHQLSDEISQLNAQKLVLEEKLSSQQSNFETQLKLVQDAKLSLSQEFENLANRIFEDKQTK